MDNKIVLTKNEKIKFCKKLPEIRKTKGYYQTDLAKVIGYTPAEICHWEHIIRLPPEESILRIVNELGIDLIEILYGKENELENKELLRFNSVEEINDAIQNMINSFPSFGEYESIVRYMAPRINNDYYSYAFNKDDHIGLDWLLTKKIKDVFNGYEDKGKSPFATYDWKFIDEIEDYGDHSKDDYLGIDGLPDHAILKGMISLE